MIWFLLGLAVVTSTATFFNERRKIRKKTFQEQKESYINNRYQNDLKRAKVQTQTKEKTLEQEPKEKLEKEVQVEQKNIKKTPAPEIKEEKVEIKKEEVNIQKDSPVPPVNETKEVVKEEIKEIVEEIKVSAPEPKSVVTPYSSNINELKQSLVNYSKALLETDRPIQSRIISLDKTILKLDTAMEDSAPAVEKYEAEALYSKFANITAPEAQTQYIKLTNLKKDKNSKTAFTANNEHELNLSVSSLFKFSKAIPETEVAFNKKKTTKNSNAPTVDLDKFPEIKKLRDNVAKAIESLEAYKIAIMKSGYSKEKRLVAINSFIQFLSTINGKKIETLDLRTITDYIIKYNEYNENEVQSRLKGIMQEYNKNSSNKEYVRILANEAILLNAFTYEKTKVLPAKDEIIEAKNRPATPSSTKKKTDNSKQYVLAKDEEGKPKPKKVIKPKKDEVTKTTLAKDQEKLEKLAEEQGMDKGQITQVLNIFGQILQNGGKLTIEAEVIEDGKQKIILTQTNKRTK